MSQTALKLKNIVKAYSEGHIAIRDVSLTIKNGEIHGLLGENGAGKATLVKILTGSLQPDDGEIIFKDEDYTPRSEVDAVKCGMMKVQDISGLVPSLTVAENIILGKRDNSIFIDKKSSVEITEKLVEEFELTLNPNTVVEYLSDQDKMLTEILKAVHHGIQMIVINQPSTHVSAGQIEYLFDLMKKLKSKDMTILYVTNSPDEIMRVCDGVTIMREGSVVRKATTRKTNVFELKNIISSGERAKLVKNTLFNPGDVVLKIRNLTTYRQSGTAGVDNISFSIREGEICALMGNGESGALELCNAIIGREKLAGGKIFVYDDDISSEKVVDIRKLGISFLVQSSGELPIADTLSIQENILPLQHVNPTYNTAGFLNNKLLKEEAQELVSEYRIECNSVEDLAGTLSKSGKRKLLFARECSNEPTLLIAYRPTENATDSNIALMQQKLIDLRNNGTAILLIPTNEQEYRSIADSTITLNNGKLTSSSEGCFKAGLAEAYMNGELEMTPEELEARCFE